MSPCARQSPISPAAGVDGCAGGWLAASTEGLVCFEAFNGLLDAFPEGNLLVDIPMGLPETTPRQIEQAARQLMPGRGSSVFPVPCRPAVYAADYRDACDINQAHFGKKLSKQAWHICGKIREVDTLLLATPALAGRVIESHPELAFSRLNGLPMPFGKKTPTGIAQRLQLLSHYWADAPALYQDALARYPRKQVARDDILDAMVLWVTAGLVSPDWLIDPQKQDEQGIPIRMMIPSVEASGAADMS